MHATESWQDVAVRITAILALCACLRYHLAARQPSHLGRARQQ